MRTPAGSQPDSPLLGNTCSHSNSFVEAIKKTRPTNGRLLIRDPLWLRDPGWVKSQDQDPESESGIKNPAHISDSLETIFCVKIIKFFDADPGIGMEKFGSGMGKIWIRGSAALLPMEVILAMVWVSVPDLWRFGKDPDPRILTTGLRTRILLFFSVAFNKK